MTFEEFCVRVADIQRETGWRLGQSIFNVLVEERPDLSEEIRGTELDPFCTIDSDRIANFYNWLQENWNQE